MSHSNLTRGNSYPLSALREGDRFYFLSDLKRKTLQVFANPVEEDGRLLYGTHDRDCIALASRQNSTVIYLRNVNDGNE